MVSKHKINITGMLFLLPAVLLSAIFFISSIIYTVGLSFTNYKGFGKASFVGISNYLKLFSDPNFLLSLCNTLVWVIAMMTIPTLLALLLAVLVTKSSKPKGIRNMIYFPNTLSSTVTGIIMGALLSSSGLPAVFGAIGLQGLDFNWLATPYLNTIVMILSCVWQGIGINLVVFIVGLNNLPEESIEAASIDGAQGLKLYTKIVFPLMKPTFVFVLLTAFVNSFKTFDTVWIMTDGGPFRTSETLAVTMYKEIFLNNNYGFGCAIAVFLSVIVLIGSIIYLQRTMRGVEYL